MLGSHSTLIRHLLCARQQRRCQEHSEEQKSDVVPAAWGFHPAGPPFSFKDVCFCVHVTVFAGHFMKEFLRRGTEEADLGIGLCREELGAQGQG